MDGAGRLRRGCTGAHGPGAGLLWPGGEKGQQVEQAIAPADQTRQPGFLQAKGFEELALVFFGGQRGNLGLDRGGDEDGAGALALSQLEHGSRMVVAFGGVFLADVADVEHGLGGQQLQLAHGLHLFG